MQSHIMSQTSISCNGFFFNYNLRGVLTREYFHIKIPGKHFSGRPSLPSLTCPINLDSWSLSPLSFWSLIFQHRPCSNTQLCPWHQNILSLPQCPQRQTKMRATLWNLGTSYDIGHHKSSSSFCARLKRSCLSPLILFYVDKPNKTKWDT